MITKYVQSDDCMVTPGDDEYLVDGWKMYGRYVCDDAIIKYVEKLAAKLISGHQVYSARTTRWVISTVVLKKASCDILALSPSGRQYKITKSRDANIFGEATLSKDKESFYTMAELEIWTSLR